MIQSKLPQVGTTIFTVMSALANEHGAINLSQGFPDFPVSEKLKNYVRDAMLANQMQYAPMAGRQDLRQAIATSIEQRHLVKLNSETEITITAGATQAIFSAMAALIQPGDEVILFDPAYDCYDPTVILFGGKPIHIPLSFPGFSIDWDRVENTITEQTKLIVLNNPNNPAASVWTETDLKSLESILEKHPQLYVISDEVYELIQFEGIHQSVLRNELIKNRAFVVYSFGKSLHVTGWKIGYCIAPPNLTSEFRKVHQFNVFCVNNTMQYAISQFLQEPDALTGISSMYHSKRKLFLDAISGSRFTPVPGFGTYFCLLNYNEISLENDVEFARRLTIEYKVASIPLSVFYQNKTDHKLLRFCFAKQDQTLLSAAEKLCKI